MWHSQLNEHWRSRWTVRDKNADLSSDITIDLDELSGKNGKLVSAQKTFAMQRSSVLNAIKDHYGQHAGASAESDQPVIPENLDKGKGKALIEGCRDLFEVKN